MNQNESQPKFLKIYTGIISGSFAGRDDGYPETRYATYNSVDDLARDFGKEANERIYALTPVDMHHLQHEIKQSLEKQAVKAKENKKASIEKQIARLQNELKKYQ